MVRRLEHLSQYRLIVFTAFEKALDKAMTRNKSPPVFDHYPSLREYGASIVEMLATVRTHLATCTECSDRYTTARQRCKEPGTAGFFSSVEYARYMRWITHP